MTIGISAMLSFNHLYGAFLKRSTEAIQSAGNYFNFGLANGIQHKPHEYDKS